VPGGLSAVGEVDRFRITAASEMPAVGEPLFMAFGAAIEVTPVMTAQDPQKGLGSLAAAHR